MTLRYGRWTVLEVEIGIGLVGIVGYGGCGLVWGLFSPQAMGFLLGIIGTAVLFYSMALSAETTLDIGDPLAAKKHSRKMHGIRYISIILVTMVVAKIEIFDVVAALLALFSLKVALYLQPFMHRLFCKRFHLTDVLSPEALILPDEEYEDGEEPDFLERWLESKYKK